MMASANEDSKMKGHNLILNSRYMVQCFAPEEEASA
jgi:hypothetical protein